MTNSGSNARMRARACSRAARMLSTEELSRAGKSNSGECDAATMKNGICFHSRVGIVGIFTRTTREAKSEEHTSELQSLMRISYAVFCLKKKTNKHNTSY